MNALNGGDLRTKLREEATFSLERTRTYAAQITAGVGHLHQHGYAWRDLKPGEKDATALRWHAREHHSLTHAQHGAPILHERTLLRQCTSGPAAPANLAVPGSLAQII